MNGTKCTGIGTAVPPATRTWPCVTSTENSASAVPGYLEDRHVRVTHVAEREGLYPSLGYRDRAEIDSDVRAVRVDGHLGDRVGRRGDRQLPGRANEAVAALVQPAMATSADRTEMVSR